MATIEERLAALEALLGMSEGETPYVSQYSGPDIDEGIELARSGTVRKTGDTMTGNLNVSPESGESFVGLTCNTTEREVYLTNATDKYAVFSTRKKNDSNNRNALWLAPEDVADIKNLLRINHKVNGAANTYRLYGEHNKPTPAAIGAVAKAGDTITGQLKFNPANTNANTSVYKNVSSAGVDYGTYILDRAENNNVYAGFRVVAASQKLQAFFRAAGATTDTNVEVLHTGNMNSLISSLRIATGTYTGTGTYGGSVTLTCGFKPAFAIIYRSDTVIGATRVPIDTNVSGTTTVYGDWTGDFAVLVPTAKGIRVSYNNTVTVESGNTYLKFTPSGTELNIAITYNYIIVGS